MTKLNDPLKRESRERRGVYSESNGQRQRSLPVADFLQKNSEIFAVIGIFAAVTTSVPRIVPDSTSAGTYAVVGGVSLFSLTGVILLDRISGEAGAASAEGKVLRSLWYTATGLSFLILASAVFQAVLSRQETAQPILDSIGAVLVGIAYFTIIRHYDIPTDGLHKSTQWAIEKSKYSSFIVLYWAVSAPEVELSLFQPPYFMAAVQASLWHGIGMMIMILLIMIIDGIWSELEEQMSQSYDRQG
ncbi:hypothetical protein [Halopelagius longus]|uniref:Uncharacterized protein n=1 Tax=Halopelagius longus TaxID=1236180 RepID=A0A1H0YT16_9EURY|nr:hypothetical protein [Halopelagius longus]SDQ18324.1 hypothetical protein SAMN05216278_0827 [Halopelagius longus]